MPSRYSVSSAFALTTLALLLAAQSPRAPLPLPLPRPRVTDTGASGSRATSPLSLPVGVSWEPPPRGHCGPRGDARGDVASGVGSSSVTVVIPRANPYSPSSFGNAVTCDGGLRLHAFRGVLSSNCSEFNTERRVVLSRTTGTPARIELTDATADVVTRLSHYDTCNGVSYDAFFVFDSFYEESFGHWAQESALFLSYWDVVRALHPERAKIVLQKRKTFKRNVLLLWGVHEDDVLTGGLPAAAALPCNVVYFPPLLSLHERRLELLALDYWRALWGHFIERLRESADTSDAPPWVSTNALVLLRGKAENLKSNDREVPVLNLIGQHAPSFLSNAGAVTVMRADRQPSLREQLRAVAAAKVVVSEAGSAANFNSAFARNATWFIIGDFRDHLAIFPGVLFVHEWSAHFNRFVYVPTGCVDVEACKPLFASMSAALSNGPLPSTWTPPGAGEWAPLADFELKG